LELSVHGEIAALAKTKKVKQKTIHAVDLFCGAGGTSTGLIDAVNGLGYAIKLTAINHWDVAIATHSKNHEDVEHYCQSIETVNPTDVIKGGRLQLLVASPECTHHSRARGGKPVSDQKRADAWLLMRWIEKLYVENILIENVKEFVEWGPLTAKNKPDKRYKGHYFRRFIETLKINYNVEYRFLNCADYGDPTTRERFFLLARRAEIKRSSGRNVLTLRVKSHGKDGQAAGPVRRYQKLEPWVPARNVIDWSLEGKSIFRPKETACRKTRCEGSMPG
jgi:DNA (cytosine-5)-methyltransferase 1